MSAYDTAVIADAPYLYWKLNEASGNPQDSSGNGRHSQGSTGTIALGAEGPPVNFDGDTACSCTAAGYFYWPPPGSDWMNPPATLECLVNRNASDSAGGYSGSRIFSCERNDYGGAWGPGFVNSTAEVALHSFGARNDSGYTISNGTWYHIVWVYGGGTWKCYVNGTKVYDAAGFGSDRRSFTPFRVGAFGSSNAGSSPSSPFYGLVSRVAIYSSALTETRIQLHASLFGAPPPNRHTSIFGFRSPIRYD